MQLLLDILNIESTSGKERALAEFLIRQLKTPYNEVEAQEVGDGTLNLYFKWGQPRIVFCTHMDTVPPYIPPTTETLPNGDVDVKGRGSCDANGQIYSMWSACKALEEKGETNFGLLLLAGEETGSFGAKAFRNMGEKQPDGSVKCAEYVVVGEPTDGKMVSASKGTKSFEITFLGKAFHSGYPQMGESAVNTFVKFMNQLQEEQFPEDEVLGSTTWNVGKLSSDNPQNVLSPELKFRLYFRTTKASDQIVCQRIPEMVEALHGTVKAYGGDTPINYLTLEGFETTTVAFGSDAPQLTNFSQKILWGAGSILCAHRDNEHVLLSELKKATENYLKMFEILKNK